MNQEKPKLWANVHQASKIYILPNFFTAGNLFFGFVSIILCMRGRFAASESHSAIHGLANIFVEVDPAKNPSASYYVVAILAILLSVFCDALDGRVARASGKTSLFGKEFDSLADAVAFGVAPCLLTFLLTLNPEQASESLKSYIAPLGWFVAFIYLLCGCIRLARFNVITNPYIAGHEKYEQGDFSGLPVPAAAGAMSSIALTMLSLNLWSYTLWIVPVMLLISFLMISNIPYPSFKHVNWDASARIRSFVAIIACILLIIKMGVYSFTIIFLLYIAIPPLKYAPKLFSIIKYIATRKR
ncbi:MAG: CDP-diacylglycerol--serine O-phosphatidyltransferase [Opitutales bacterium]|nr:CDP-diacylglycerol--serine O-phosphatidyltransferase [Opitutales bacterium]